ncbi:condensation domain-containing protein, partial [Paludibacterium sp.]|uniref:condensation domain-containing protein n=1 Tax=Paludibacterium sp. TaxID=1917523 RepID=UPI0025F88682
LIFLGRADRQVKIRGFRIEPGEIQAALLAHDGVDAAAVIARDGQLLAYVSGAEHDDAVLRRHLAQRLPDYMLPAMITPLAALPLTTNGKLDEAALPRPARQGAAYRAPESEAERLLCQLMAEVLGVERVGPDDNFFTLGGDSIVSIQLIRRLRDAGYDLPLRKVFQAQDTAALSLFLTPRMARPIEAQATDDGEVTPTPLMQWQLGRNPSIRPFSQSMLIQLPPAGADQTGFEARLARTLAALQAKHEMLRLTVTPTSEHTWRLAVGADATPWLVSRALSAGITPDWAALAAETRAALSPASGRMLAALCLHTPTQSRLLLTIHHFAVDGVSWPILLADLAALWQQADRAVPAVTAEPTFRRWSAALFHLAGQTAARAQWPAWRAQTDGAAPLLAGARLQPARDTFARAGRLRVSPSVETSLALLALPAAYHAGVEDILLAALALAVHAWRRERSDAATAFAVEVESHGRETPDDTFDLSRTVGWFTSLYPLRLDTDGLSVDAMLAGADDLGQLIKRVKEQARALPGLFAEETPARGRGLAYGYLRHFTPEGRQGEEAQIGFNYLGRLGSADTPWQPDLSVADALRMTENDCTLLHPLDLDIAFVGEGRAARLVADWTWAPDCVPDAVARSLAGHWRMALEALARHGARHGGHTPSDFPLLALSQPAIERIETVMPQIDALLPLSPLQEGLLFHARFDDDAPDLYTVQLALVLTGPIDGERLRRAALAMLRRHPQLCARFLRDPQQRPLQALGGEARLPWREVDLSALPANEAEAGYRQARLHERQQRFALDTPPLMRMMLARLPGAAAWIITHHHLLMDGWSLSLFVSGVLAHYRQDAPALPPPRYADYLDWVARQDREAAQGAWRAYLDGVAEPCRLARQTGAGQTVWPRRWQRQLSPELGEALARRARAWRVTLNTVLQGLWAVLMARLTGQDDVVFGITVSGRPAEVAGIEQMLGLFISTLPLRARLAPGERLATFLARLQDEQARLTPFQHVGLAEIQQAAGVSELFDTLIVFENYPWDPNLSLNDAGLRLQAIEPDDATHYPVNLIITPGARLDLRLQYDSARLTDGDATRIGEGFIDLLQYVAAHPDMRLEELDLLSDAERHAVIELPNQTRAPIAPRPLHALFEASAQGRPEALALSGHTLDGLRADWSYTQINARANRLAHALIQHGVAPGDRVAVCLPRALELPMALLAVLKAGAAYVP